MANNTPICPWGFLAPSPPPTPVASTARIAPQQKISFAQALTNTIAFPLSQLPRPCFKGDALSIKISEDEYQAGLAGCKHNLHGRLVLSKGDAPVKLQELREKLSKLWQPLGEWRVVPLGKGFFEFCFAAPEDLRSVWTVGAWNLQPGILRLSRWTPDFNPYSLRNTHAQCWVRLLGLPQEYWRPKILFEIAGAIGTPVSLDEATRNKTLGHFARIQVDIDLSGRLHDQILVEREGFAFFVAVEFEKLPLFCSNCQTIGHLVTTCRKKASVAPNAGPAQEGNKEPVPRRSKVAFVPRVRQNASAVKATNFCPDSSIPSNAGLHETSADKGKGKACLNGSNGETSGVKTLLQPIEEGNADRNPLLGFVDPGIGFVSSSPTGFVNILEVEVSPILTG